MCFSKQFFSSKTKAGNTWCTTAHQALYTCHMTPARSHTLGQKGSKYLAKYICLVHLTLLDLHNGVFQRGSLQDQSLQDHNLGLTLLFVLKLKLWATKPICKILHKHKTKTHIASCPLFLLFSPYSFQCAYIFS